jgi:hypothetical protein
MNDGPLRCWDDVAAFALALPGTERGTSYRMPTVKVAANGRGFVWTSHEAENLVRDLGRAGGAEMLIETDPETFWQSPHYVGSNAVLGALCERRSGRVRHRIACVEDLVAAMKPAASGRLSDGTEGEEHGMRRIVVARGMQLAACGSQGEAVRANADGETAPRRSAPSPTAAAGSAGPRLHCPTREPVDEGLRSARRRFRCRRHCAR